MHRDVALPRLVGSRVVRQIVYRPHMLLARRGSATSLYASNTPAGYISSEIS